MGTYIDQITFALFGWLVTFVESSPEFSVTMIVVLPLIGFLINGLFGSRMSRWGINFTGTLFPFLSLLLAFGWWLAFESGEPRHIEVGTWIHMADQKWDLNIGWGWYLDSLSMLMLMIVTGIGFLIHLYSVGYMRPETGVHKYFAYMNLFLSSMLILILADNLVLLFLGWEGVGLCSYLLISFFYHREDFAAAGKKAFVFNRVGDAGFLIGVILIFFAFGTVTMVGTDSSLASIISNVSLDQNQVPVLEHESYSPLFGLSLMALITMITLFLFIGATGKSAQIPLYTWLPDAMAGPTPVSALIHAATMVTAGVYLIARLWFMFNMTLAPTTLSVIGIVAVITSIVAGIIGLSQTDIKKVLAYSTVSQLGFMFMAMAAGAYAIGMFHVTTHAFFKALLFLSAGSVILSLHHIYGEEERQDMRYMGGLRKFLPITFICFLIGALSLSGIPLFSGFFSKDQVLEMVFFNSAYGLGPLIWALGAISAILTAAYTWRLMALTFWNKTEIPERDRSHVHESSRSVLLVIIVLALGAIGIGYVGLPEFIFGHGSNLFVAFLDPVFQNKGTEVLLPKHGVHEDHGILPIVLMAVSIIIAVGISLLFYWLYTAKRSIPESFTASGVGKSLKTASSNLLYVDEMIDFLIAKPYTYTSRFLWKLVDEFIIDKVIVGGIAWCVRLTGHLLRLPQTGNVNLYTSIVVAGAILVFIIVWIVSYQSMES